MNRFRMLAALVAACSLVVAACGDDDDAATDAAAGDVSDGDTDGTDRTDDTPPDPGAPPSDFPDGSVVLDGLVYGANPDCTGVEGDAVFWEYEIVNGETNNVLLLSLSSKFIINEEREVFAANVARTDGPVLANYQIETSDSAEDASMSGTATGDDGSDLEINGLSLFDSPECGGFGGDGGGGEFGQVTLGGEFFDPTSACEHANDSAASFDYYFHLGGAAGNFVISDDQSGTFLVYQENDDGLFRSADGVADEGEETIVIGSGTFDDGTNFTFEVPTAGLPDCLDEPVPGFVGPQA